MICARPSHNDRPAADLCSARKFLHASRVCRGVFPAGVVLLALENFRAHHIFFIWHCFRRPQWSSRDFQIEPIFERCVRFRTTKAIDSVRSGPIFCLYSCELCLAVFFINSTRYRSCNHSHCFFALLFLLSSEAEPSFCALSEFYLSGASEEAFSSLSMIFCTHVTIFSFPWPQRPSHCKAIKCQVKSTKSNFISRASRILFLFVYMFTFSFCVYLLHVGIVSWLYKWEYTVQNEKPSAERALQEPPLQNCRNRTTDAALQI